MITKGTFGYIIGRKKRFMYVDNDADLLWQILVREIYILMKHFQTKEHLQKAFEKIKTTKSKPKPKDSDIDKNKIFLDFSKDGHDWYSLLQFCQGSFINILESGYIINEPEERGHVFLLDFNKGNVRFYKKNWDGIIHELDTATIEEIMEFDDMPAKSYPEIISEMTARFNDYYSNLTRIEKELEKIKNVMNEAKKQCSYNIEEKTSKLLEKMNLEKTKLHMNRRVFYHRLKALDLIETSEDGSETPLKE